jgi:ArsR family transcriptional regulator
MLAIARDRLARAQISHGQVRLGDIHRLPFPDGSALQGFDAAVIHQVLHYLDDPGAAVAEAARVLRPGGRILIVDFASHDLEVLRSDFAHRRLGFSDREVQGWFHSAGLRSQGSDSIAAGEARLTVKIWTARAPSAARREAA